MNLHLARDNTGNKCQLESHKQFLGFQGNMISAAPYGNVQLAPSTAGGGDMESKFSPSFTTNVACLLTVRERIGFPERLDRPCGFLLGASDASHILRDALSPYPIKSVRGGFSKYLEMESDSQPQPQIMLRETDAHVARLK